MVRVALTGGIATGKSHVSRALAARGIPTIDADVLAREALAPGSTGARAVVERFGDAVRAPGGAIDRKALGRIIFGDAQARRDLEAIVHPCVYERIDDWFRTVESPAGFAVAEIPLLFETAREHDFDRVVVVACAPERQIERAMARDGLAEADVRARLAAQWPIREKVAKADHVIHTDGTFAETDEQIERVIEALRREARTGV